MVLSSVVLSFSANQALLPGRVGALGATLPEQVLAGSRGDGFGAGRRSNRSCP